MFLTSLRAAIKAIARHRLNSALNVVGFAFALALTLIVAMYSYRQLSVNMFHRDVERIYKVSGWGTPYAMTQLIRDRFPEIESITGVTGRPNSPNYLDTIPITTSDQAKVLSRGTLNVDNDFFNVFTFPLIHGDQASALTKPNSVVLSQSAAKMLFPDTENPVGRLVFGYQGQYTVTGITADCPENASLCYDLLVSVVPNEPLKWDPTQTMATNWKSYAFECFIKVREGTDIEDLQQRIQDRLKEEGNLQYEVGYVILYPFDDLYFRDDLYTSFDGGDRKQVHAMIWVGIIVLVLAIINFFNLSTASATLRTKEIGVRKVNGSSRGSLIAQFIAESTILTFLGFVLAFGLANLAIPWFNRFIGIQFDYLYLQTVEQWLFFAVATLLVGIIAGCYPAFYLSGFRPMDVLFTSRNSLKTGVAFIRKGLIVLQLAASIGIVVCTIVIGRQLDYLLNKDLGFDKNQILWHYPFCPPAMTAGYVSQVAQLPFVESVSLTNGMVGMHDSGTTLKAEAQGEERDIICKLIVSDTAFVNTFGLQLTRGRNFRAGEQNVIIINEEAARQSPGSDPLQVVFRDNDKKDWTYQVVGVVKDFHFKSLHNTIEPLMIINDDFSRTYGITNIRIAPKALDSLRQTSLAISQCMMRNGMESFMAPTTLNEKLEQSYDSEKQFKTSFNIFSGLAIFISCFGLFGLTIFTNNRRKKEIALRRIHGATVRQIIGRLIKDYLWLLAIAFVVACPAAYYICSSYLSGFPYRVPFSVVPYIYATLAVAAIMFTTVTLHSWWAANRNPAKTIKTE